MPNRSADLAASHLERLREERRKERDLEPQGSPQKKAKVGEHVPDAAPLNEVPVVA